MLSPGAAGAVCARGGAGALCRRSAGRGARCSAGPGRAAVSGVPAGPGPVSGETSPGKAPRRAASKGWGRGGRLPRGGSRWLAKALAPLLSRSPGVPGMRGMERGSPPRGAGKCPWTCPLPGAAAGPARGGRRPLRCHPAGPGAGGSAGRASLRFACAERLPGARLAGRRCEGPALAPGGPPASGRVS